jgi:DNA-binding response OmpR family regulator
MQWEKATGLELAVWELTGPPAFDEPPEPLDDGLPPLQAAASRTRTVLAVMAAVVRAIVSRARHGRRMTRVLSFIMVSSRAWVVAAPGRRCASGLAAFRSWAALFEVVRGAAAYPLSRVADDRSRTVVVRPMSSGQAHNVQVRVLVVEDHVALANRIGEGLRDAGFAVDVVYDGAAALEATASTGYDVVVLDRDLPAVHGDRVCRQLVRDGSPSRILMLTAATDVEDRVDGLELGADDYLGKPFAFGELIARIRALGRRGPGSPAVVQRGDLVVDRARHRASRAGIPLTLTRKEFGVLECLAGSDGAAVSAEELLEHVWDAHADPFSNTVAVTVGRLRRKLGDPPLIETVPGVGYRL